MAWRGLVEQTGNKYGPATDLTRWSLEVSEGRQVRERVRVCPSALRGEGVWGRKIR
jgi:hypothetical protein